MTQTAIVTGSGGKLGPVWLETLKEMYYNTWALDLPECDVSDISSIYVYKRRNNPYACILINNAAVDSPPTEDGLDFFTYHKEIDVNLKGAINMCKVFIPDMIAMGGGLVINVGSIMGTIGADWRNYPEGFSKPVGYNVSKAGLNQLTRSICVEYGRYNIRAVSINFGPVDTGKLPPEFLSKFLKNVPLARPVSIGSLKATLRYVLTCPELSGQSIMVDGGYTVW